MTHRPMTRHASVPSVDVEVVIVGAGFAGLAAALKLRATGRTDFTVLERADRPGGTWRDNVYPGVACDVPAPLYSLSGRPHASWSREYAPGAEIEDYLCQVADEPDLSDHLRYATALTSARWSTTQQCWQLTTSRGPLTCRVLLLCAGRFATPKTPHIPGIESFAGTVMHSARWQPSFDPAGLRIGVVGTGASALQLAPELAQTADSLVIFQRRAPWVLHRAEQIYSDQDRATLTQPADHAAIRASIFDQQEALFDGRRSASTSLAQLQTASLTHLAESISDPEVRRSLTPTDAPGCRRIVFSNRYYECIERGDITLEPSALTRVADSTAFGRAASSYDLDVIVFATGFDVRDQPYARLITGRRGRTLADRWAEGLHAVGSVAVPEFPNMFVVNGPQATLGHNSSLLTIEAQVDVVIQALMVLARQDEPLEATEAAASRDRSALQTRAAQTVWASGCDSWYLNPDGTPGLLWPGTFAEFVQTYGTFRPDDYAPTTTALEFV